MLGAVKRSNNCLDDTDGEASMGHATVRLGHGAERFASGDAKRRRFVDGG
jgi:hypothetical protein